MKFSLPTITAFAINASVLMYVAFANIRQITALELSSWEEEEVPEDQADEFLLKYASNDSEFKDGTLFILESDQFVENDGQRSYLASDQDVFQWHIQFSSQIKSSAENIPFAMITGGKRYDYTAWKDSIINDADDINIIEKHAGHYYWHGTIKSNGSDEEIGDITCSLAWGEILLCEVEVAEDPFEAVYNIVMEREKFYFDKTMIKDLADDYDDSTHRSLRMNQDREDFANHANDTIAVTSQTEGEAAGSFSRTRKLAPPKGATDILVFYTTAATTRYHNSAGLLEVVIESRVNDFNNALYNAGVRDANKFLHLVGVFYVFDSKNWNRGSELNKSELIKFDGFDYFKKMREMYGADISYLIDNWNAGSNGKAWIGGSSGLVRASYIGSYTFLHEVGHNYGLHHCDGEVENVSNNRGQSTLMNYSTRVAPRVKRFSSLSAKILKDGSGTANDCIDNKKRCWDVARSGCYDGGTWLSAFTSAEKCCTRSYYWEGWGAFCTDISKADMTCWKRDTSKEEQREISNAKIKRPSKGAARVSPGSIGHVRTGQYSSCSDSKIKALGLQYYQNGSYDEYKLYYYIECGGGTKKWLGRASGSYKRFDKVVCNSGSIGGVGLYQYYVNGRNRLRLAVYCPDDGVGVWKYTPHYNGLKNFDWADNQSTSDPSRKRLSRIYWRGYRSLFPHFDDTYSMDIMFDV